MAAPGQGPAEPGHQAAPVEGAVSSFYKGVRVGTGWGGRAGGRPARAGACPADSRRVRLSVHVRLERPTAHGSTCMARVRDCEVGRRTGPWAAGPHGDAQPRLVSKFSRKLRGPTLALLLTPKHTQQLQVSDILFQLKGPRRTCRRAGPWRPEVPHSNAVWQEAPGLPHVLPGQALLWDQTRLVARSRPGWSWGCSQCLP